MSPSGFADSQRPLNWIRSRISPSESAGAACLELVLLGEVVVRHHTAGDPLRADHAGVADVDHVRVLEVQADAEADEENGRGEQHRRLPERARCAHRTRARADPDAACEQVDERRIGKRDAREDVPVVEVPERDRERQQCEQVEIAKRQQPAEVCEAEQEDHAEREPDRPRVDLLASECALVATGHLPGDLWAGPRFGDSGRGVVDLALRDFSGVDALVLVAPPDMHRPASTLCSRTLRRVRLVGRVGDTALARIAVEPVGHLVAADEDRCRALLGKSRIRGRDVRDESRCREHGHGNRKDEPQCRLRNDQSLLPMKFAGVTRTIAIACATIFPTPNSTSNVRMARLPT